MYLPSQGRRVRVRWYFLPPETPLVRGPYLYSSSDWDLTRDVFPGYGEDGSDSREYANGSKWFAAEMTGRGGAEGNGKADMEVVSDAFCPTVTWGLEMDGFDEDWPTDLGCLELVKLSPGCQWDQGGVSGTKTVLVTLSDEGGDPRTAGINLQLWNPYPISIIGFANYAADISAYSGGDLVFDLVGQDPGGAPATLTVHQGGCGNAEMTGRGGAEGNGKAKVGVNEMTGNAGPEINGKATIDVT